MDPTLLLLRWAHILAAIVAMGGLVFARFALLPAVSELDEETQQRFHDRVRRSWLPWVIGAITVLLASGLANFLLFNTRVKAEGWADGMWMRQTSYHALFGLKFLMAMVAFYFASALVGRGAGSQWVRDDRAKWLAVTLGLTTGVVLLSGWMRQLHTGPNLVGSGVRIDASAAGDRRLSGDGEGDEGDERYRDGNAGWRFRQRGPGGEERGREDGAAPAPAATDAPAAVPAPAPAAVPAPAPAAVPAPAPVAVPAPAPVAVPAPAPVAPAVPVPAQ